MTVHDGHDLIKKIRPANIETKTYIAINISYNKHPF